MVAFLGYTNDSNEPRALHFTRLRRTGSARLFMHVATDARGHYGDAFARRFRREQRWHTNLTNHPAFDGWPAWSPDGREIAFASNRNANYQIFVMRADGSGVRLVANTEGRATAPVWSRDGKTIYFTNCQKRDYGTGCEIFAAPAPQ